MLKAKQEYPNSLWFSSKWPDYHIVALFNFQKYGFKRIYGCIWSIGWGVRTFHQKKRQEPAHFTFSVIEILFLAISWRIGDYSITFAGLKCFQTLSALSGSNPKNIMRSVSLSIDILPKKLGTVVICSTPRVRRVGEYVCVVCSRRGIPIFWSATKKCNNSSK